MCSFRIGSSTRSNRILVPLGDSFFLRSTAVYIIREFSWVFIPLSETIPCQVVGLPCVGDIREYPWDCKTGCFVGSPTL